MIKRRWRMAVRGAAVAMIGGAVLVSMTLGAAAQAQPVAKPEGAIRVALFNSNLSRGKPGVLADQIRGGKSEKVAAVVEIIQRVDPDILVLQEIDWDRDGEALKLLERALAKGRSGAAGVTYAYRIQPPVNTGDRSGVDLDNNGKTNGPADAFGWGVFPGQFGFAVLSKHPIDLKAARTFRLLKWKDTPFAALRPKKPGGAWFHSEAAWDVMRLSSKTHLDAPITLPNGAVLHVLVSHPTPPVFDGPEDRNGARNAAEVLFWKAYLGDGNWIRDDQGRRGGLADKALFVIAGDLNADPADGDGRQSAINAVLSDPKVQDPRPSSRGAASAAASQGGANAKHKGDPAFDTADWRDNKKKSPGNLRVDYVLPSAQLKVVGSGVFWPAAGDPLFRLVGSGFPIVSSDHRLVWVDIVAP